MKKINKYLLTFFVSLILSFMAFIWLGAEFITYYIKDSVFSWWSLISFLTLSAIWFTFFILISVHYKEKYEDIAEH